MLSLSLLNVHTSILDHFCIKYVQYYSKIFTTQCQYGSAIVKNHVECSTLRNYTLLVYFLILFCLISHTAPKIYYWNRNRRCDYKILILVKFIEAKHICYCQDVNVMCIYLFKFSLAIFLFKIFFCNDYFKIFDLTFKSTKDKRKKEKLFVSKKVYSFFTLEIKIRYIKIFWILKAYCLLIFFFTQFVILQFPQDFGRNFFLLGDK